MSRVLLVADRSYNNNSALTTQLGGMGITLLETSNLSVTAQQAHAWAISNGVPWICRASYLDAAGEIGVGPRAWAAILLSNPDTVLTAGSGGQVNSAANTAKARNITLDQI